MREIINGIGIALVIFGGFFIFLFNIFGLLYGFETKCSTETRLINNNFITGAGFQLSCLRGNQEVPEKNQIRVSGRTEREREIDNIAAKACIDNGGIPEISSWDSDVICKYPKK